VEEQFYLAWPLILVALLSRAARGTVGRWFLIAAGVMCFVEAITSSLFSLGWTYFTPLGNAAGLLAGSGVALCRLRAPRALGLVGLAVLVIICFTAPDIEQRSFFRGWVQLAVISSAVLVAWLASDDRAPVFSQRGVLWLGRRSYGLYLVHQAVLLFIVAVLTNPSTRVATVLGIPLALLLAALMYRYVEAPFLRLKRNYAPRPAPAGG
jgi:peptidoglycan/LPS O-acetylase OafA/YrhL